MGISPYLQIQCLELLHTYKLHHLCNIYNTRLFLLLFLSVILPLFIYKVHGFFPNSKIILK